MTKETKNVIKLNKNKKAGSLLLMAVDPKEKNLIFAQNEEINSISLETSDSKVNKL